MTLTEHSKKAGVSKEVLKDAFITESTMFYSPMYVKWNSIQISTGCTEEEAKTALGYVWDNLVVEV